MKRMRIVAITVSVIFAVVLTAGYSRGSAIVKSQLGCPASKLTFKVDYFGFPLKDRWICEISQEFPQGGSVTFYKSGSILKAAADAALGLAVVLLPALYLSRCRSR